MYFDISVVHVVWKLLIRLYMQFLQFSDELSLTVVVVPAQPLLSGSGPSRSSLQRSSGNDVRARSSTKQYPSHLHRDAVRKRIVAFDNKSPHVIRNIVNVVCTLERWLWRTHEESRRVETLPPMELDTYLTEFFSVLKKPTGDDYDPHSFKGFPTNLDRFLKEHSYPVSIKKSSTFSNSQSAYRVRFQELTKSAQIRKRIISQYSMSINNSQADSDVHVDSG